MEGSGGELSGYTPEELELSDWAHRKLVDAFGLETEAWATDVVRRAADRLQAQRGDAPPVEPVVLWLQEMTAFAVPGPYVYVSRELLQRCASEDPVALVLGHEVAHHDLGHTAIFTGRLDKLRGVLGGKAIALVLHAAEHLAFSHEMESQADAYAFDLCLKAGYDGHRCLELFDILEHYALDLRDLDIVYGPDSAEEEPDSHTSGWLAKARTWGWERMRGYPPIHERRAALLRRIDG